jgi:hypothetical protein
MKDMPANNVVSLAPNSRKEEAEAVQARARVSLEDALTSIGDDIGGYAVVVFGRDGEAATGVCYQFLPWGRTPMATFVHDALAHHAARVSAKEDREDPDGGFVA